MEINPWLILIGCGAFLACAPLIIMIDRMRIRRHISSLGSHVLNIRWRPFKGSDLSEQYLREYEVIYKDSTDQIHHCMSKIAFLSSVHVLEDKIIAKKD